jgi:sensor histidine kinase YesM
MIQLQYKRRFTFGRIFLVLFTIYAALFILGFFVSHTTPKMLSSRVYTDPRFLIGQGLSLMLHTVFYFFVLNYYHKLFAEKKGFVHFLGGSAIAAILYVFYLLLNDQFFSTGEITGPLQKGLLIAAYAFNTLFATGISLLIAYLVYLQDAKKQQKILEQQKIELEMEKTYANLNFLKAQINPHFLHNTLNFLYAKSLPYSTELSEGILTLSDIMRYALSEANLKDGKAALKDEVEHVRNVIKIHQLRFSNNLQVNFEVTGVLNGTTIIPFVLITIVENAFKHGDLKDTTHPIDVKLAVEHNSIRFYCHNKKKAGPKELSTGIGLDNIKKRLDLAYRDHYTLIIKDEPDFYTTQLTINTL